jgi:hypothetical protein
MGTAVRFVWFWTFWHWSKESFRAEVVPQRPLGNIARLWDEWYCYEASAEDRDAIEEAESDEGIQRAFVQWFFRAWNTEANPSGNQLVPTFVMRELARVDPFERWSSLAEYRLPAKIDCISAIVLEDTNFGKASDIRAVEAELLPSDSIRPSGTIVPVDFKVDISELNSVRQAVLKSLSGSELARLLAWWTFAGVRPYPRWLGATMSTGWIVITGLIAILRFGPEPGTTLVPLAGTVLALWGALMVTAIAGVVRQIATARRAGRNLASHLSKDEIRLRVSGGLELKGGSAGLAFCLGILASSNRAYPQATAGSWLWSRFFNRLREAPESWAATGVVTADGQIRPVMVEAKLRSCAEHPRINQIIVPSQPGAKQRTTSHLRVMPTGSATAGETAPDDLVSQKPRKLMIYRCRNLANAIFKIGRIGSGTQRAVNALALVTSGVMFVALSNLWCILVPPPPPIAIAPSSPSPYFLWVSLDTAYPDFFQVALESPMWANRHASVARYKSAPASVRAEIRLVRTISPDTLILDQGTVWIERRPYFLGRAFEPGERVGNYSVAYLNRLGYQ